MISLCPFVSFAMQDEENESFEILQILEGFTFLTTKEELFLLHP